MRIRTPQLERTKGFEPTEQNMDGPGYEDELEQWGEDREQADALDLSGIPVDNTVDLYLREVGRVPLLDREDEVTLAKQLKRGQKAQRRLARGGCKAEEKDQLEEIVRRGEEARRHLIEANVRLVVSIAGKYTGYGLPFSDLIQAGNEGLIKAVDKFDYRRGTRFSTHATWWIRQAVTRTLSQQGRTIRLPVYLQQRISRLKKAAESLHQDLGRRPTSKEIAEQVELDPDAVCQLLQISRSPLSLDMPVGEDGKSELGALIEDETAPSPTQLAEMRLQWEAVLATMTTLSPREAYILRRRYGLEHERTHTLAEIGEELGITHERVRQIEGEALSKLRARLN